MKRVIGIIAGIAMVLGLVPSAQAVKRGRSGVTHHSIFLGAGIDGDVTVRLPSTVRSRD